VKLANTALGEVRRRVQQDTLGHRGHAGDPLSRIRRLLLREMLDGGRGVWRHAHCRTPVRPGGRRHSRHGGEFVEVDRSRVGHRADGGHSYGLDPETPVGSAGITE
jgi:hypothetical protein